MLVLLHCRHCDAKEHCAVIGDLAICRTCVREAAQEYARHDREERRRELENERPEPPRKGA